MEGPLQRLFTTFADGWPGFGLLVQRLVTGLALFYEAIVESRGTVSTASIAPHVLGVMLGVFIVIGMWTPVAGALIAAIEIWIALEYPGAPETAILLGTFGATLAMVGPGAFSIDARLFGRKQIGNGRSGRPLL